MSTPKPNLDLFTDSPCLVSKKSRTSTPSLRPPKPPTKTSNSIRRHRPNGYQPPISHDGSFSYGLLLQNGSIHQQKENYSRLNQQFEIISKIGSGSFGDVYKVKSLEDNRYFAIKKTLMPFTSEADRKRKLQEVKNHQSLPPHENCVKYHDSWEEDGYLYIQTELCKSSLNEVLETSEEHKLPEQTIWKYLLDLLLAVKHLHDNELLHLDIKPDNIFISFDNVAKLGDFGLMCNYQDLNSSNSHHTSNLLTTSMLSTSSDLNDILSSGDDAISFQHQTSKHVDHDDSGILNKSYNSTTMANFFESSSLDSIEEGDSKYLAGEAMQGRFTKAADIFSLGLTMFEVASGLDLPQRGEVYHKLRQNQIDDHYFNGLGNDLTKVIKLMMEADYTKRPFVDDLLQLDVVRAMRSTISKNNC